MRVNPRLGYAMAGVTAVISGTSIYVNSLGVGSVVRDATLYTTLKNSVVGVAALVPLLLVGSARRELLSLRGRRWAWLAALAVVGGSVPYVLFFEGLRLTTATTGSLLNHLQFALVAPLAAVFLRERLPGWLWGAVAAILGASFLGVDLDALRFGPGVFLLLASTALFAAGFVIAKHLLRELSTQTVLTAKMTGGSLLLMAYAGLGGHLGAVSRLTAPQWAWTVAAGLLLLAFTAAILVAIRHAPVTAVLAIGTASPLITLALQFAAGRAARPGAVEGASLAVTAVGAAVIAIWGARRERRPGPRGAAA